MKICRWQDWNCIRRDFFFERELSSAAISPLLLPVI